MFSMIWLCLLALLSKVDAKSWPIAAYNWKDVGASGLSLYGGDFLDVDEACRDDVKRHEAVVQVLWLPKVAGAHFCLIRSHNCPDALVYVAKLKRKKLHLFGRFRTVPDSFVLIGPKFGFRWLEKDSTSLSMVVTAINDTAFFRYRPGMLLWRDQEGVNRSADSTCCSVFRKRVIRDSVWQMYLGCPFMKSMDHPAAWCETQPPPSMCGDLYNTCGGN